MRVRIMLPVRAISESLRRVWANTLTLSKAKGPSSITGAISRCASMQEKPALGSLDHCIGVRTASRSGRSRSSPMPISSP